MMHWKRKCAPMQFPTKTKAVTAWGIGIYTEWAAHRASKTSSVSGVRDLETPLLSMRSEALSYWLGKFVLEARKKNGDEYPPKTLYQIVCCFKRHFEANGIHSFNPLNPQEPAFGNFRRTLDAEMQRLHCKGLGTQTRQAEPITEDEEIQLWSAGQLGKHSAQALLNTVYFCNCKMFGLRSQDEHRGLKVDQFQKKVDKNGKVYLQFTEHASKTNRGGLHHMKVNNKIIRQYENTADPDRCIVNIYVLYFLLIPKTGHFYYKPLANKGELLRFTQQLIGIQTLAKLIPRMCEAAGVSGRKTGHSGKVTCATTLYRKNFPDQQIKERTGHRSIEALYKYKRTSSIQHQEVSDALQPPALTSLADSHDTVLSVTKKPKLDGCPDFGGLLPQSTLNNCTLSINMNVNGQQ